MNVRLKFPNKKKINEMNELQACFMPALPNRSLTLVKDCIMAALVERMSHLLLDVYKRLRYFNPL